MRLANFFLLLINIAFREEAIDFTHPFLFVGLGVLGFKGTAPKSLEDVAEDDSVKVILVNRKNPLWKFSKLQILESPNLK